MSVLAATPRRRDLIHGLDMDAIRFRARTLAAKGLALLLIDAHLLRNTDLHCMKLVPFV